jgi:hypothetical protein
MKDETMLVTFTADGSAFGLPPNFHRLISVHSFKFGVSPQLMVGEDYGLVGGSICVTGKHIGESIMVRYEPAPAPLTHEARARQFMLDHWGEGGMVTKDALAAAFAEVAEEARREVVTEQVAAMTAAHVAETKAKLESVEIPRVPPKHCMHPAGFSHVPQCWSGHDLSAWLPTAEPQRNKDIRDGKVLSIREEYGMAMEIAREEGLLPAKACTCGAASTRTLPHSSWCDAA